MNKRSIRYSKYGSGRFPLFDKGQMKIAILMIALIAVASVSATAFHSEEVVAEPKEIDSIAELLDAIQNATEDVHLTLTDEFAKETFDDTITIVINHDHNITIDGNDIKLIAGIGKSHIDITNDNLGMVTFTKIKFINEGEIDTGGLVLRNGNYNFIDCTFQGMTNIAVSFNGNENDALFENCTFKDNNKRAVVTAGGTNVDTAEYTFYSCLFENNSMTNGGGGAIYSTQNFVVLDIKDSVFKGNKAIGTGTLSASNNRVDGGALYINASWSTDVNVHIDNTYFEGNFAQDDGGAILIEGKQTITTIKTNIINSTFYNNTIAGAHYGKSGIWCTDGSGGAINFFGMTESEITHCTFYGNGITNALPSGVTGSNMGSVGGGGAIAVDTGSNISEIGHLPPMPKLTNNVFVGNYITKPMPQNTIDFISNIIPQFKGLKERSGTGNVFVLPACDADFQDFDPRGFDNNGNIGYDNGKYDTYGNSKPNNYNNNGINVTDGIIIKNIFAKYDAKNNDDDTDDVPIPTEYGDLVGASGSTTKRYCFILSPTSNELYRDGSVPYVAEVPYDALGNKRDTFPNAGAVEIFWTLFNPGADADWTEDAPTSVKDPSDPNISYNVIESLKFTINNSYYVMTAVGNLDHPSGNVIAMPRSSIIHNNGDNFGFMGWRSNIPNMEWEGYAQWATSNGYSETTMAEFLTTHPVSDLPKEAFPLYQPGDVIRSVKQTLTAEWVQEHFRVDFDLNHTEIPNWYNSSEPGIETPRINIPSGDSIAAPIDPVRAGYVFIGWYKENSCINAWKFDTDPTPDLVTADIILYAGWAEACTITYHGNGADEGDAPVDNNNPYANGSTVTVLEKGTLKKNGHEFIGWNTLPNSSEIIHEENSKFVITGDVDLYPVWKRSSEGGNVVKYVVDSSCDDGSSITPYGRTTVSKGTDITFTFSAKYGHHIVSVLIDGKQHQGLIEATSFTFSNIQANHTIEVISAEDEPPPLEGGDTEGDDGWAPLNLICAIITILAGIVGLIGGKNRVSKDDISKRSGKAAILRVISTIVGIVALVVFFLTEDMSQPIVIADEWTLLMAILMIVSVTVMFTSFRLDEERETDLT